MLRGTFGQEKHTNGHKTLNAAESTALIEMMKSEDKICFLRDKGVTVHDPSRNPVLGEETPRLSKEERRQRRLRDEQLRLRQGYAAHKARDPLAGEATPRDVKDLAEWREGDRAASGWGLTADGRRTRRVKVRRKRTPAEKQRRRESNQSSHDVDVPPRRQQVRPQSAAAGRSQAPGVWAQEAQQMGREKWQTTTGLIGKDSWEHPGGRGAQPRPRTAPSGGRHRPQHRPPAPAGEPHPPAAATAPPPAVPAAAGPRPQRAPPPSIPVGGNWKSVGPAPKPLEEQGNTNFVRPPWATGLLGPQGTGPATATTRPAARPATAASARPSTAGGGGNRRRPSTAGPGGRSGGGGTGRSRRPDLLAEVSGVRDNIEVLKAQLQKVDLQIQTLDEFARPEGEAAAAAAAAAGGGGKGGGGGGGGGGGRGGGEGGRRARRAGRGSGPAVARAEVRRRQAAYAESVQKQQRSRFARDLRRAQAAASLFQQDFQDPRTRFGHMTYNSRVNFGFDKIGAMRRSLAVQKGEVAVSESARAYLQTL